MFIEEKPRHDCNESNPFSNFSSNKNEYLLNISIVKLKYEIKEEIEFEE